MQTQMDSAPSTNPRTWIRDDGWTVERQAAFLAAVAEGATVESACRHVGLSAASAYALRHRAAGASFALGWRAANLKARDKLADLLMSRVIDGNTDTVTAPDGKVVARHRHDNRLGLAMLTRLDRLADEDAGGSSGHAARLVAQDFEPFLEMLQVEGGPARAGLFVGLRALETADPDLAAVATLARADRFLRTGAGLAGEVEIADLDWTNRASWTAEQWQRAEAAGLLSVAAPASDEPRGEEGEDGTSQQSQLLPEEEALALYTGEIDRRCFPNIFPEDWDDTESRWMTSFPPPDGFDGEESGYFGDPDYRRTLSDEEMTIFKGRIETGIARMASAEAARRDAYFGLPSSQVSETDEPDVV